MMEWAAPEVANLPQQNVYLDDPDQGFYDAHMAPEPEVVPEQDVNPVDDVVLAIEDAPPAVVDTIMAPPPTPMALPPPVEPAPVTPPKKKKDPPMSQSKRAKGDSGAPIVKRTMADGLDMAYRDPDSRATIGTVAFLAGTKAQFSDLADDLLILEGRVRETEKYRRAREWFTNLSFKPTMIVGHSLGAAVARALSEDLYIPCTTFNDPTPSWNRDQPGNFSSAMDPISMLNWGQQSSPSSSWNPHNYHGKASRRSYDLDPHLPDDIP